MVYSLYLLYPTFLVNYWRLREFISAYYLVEHRANSSYPLQVDPHWQVDPGFLEGGLPTREGFANLLFGKFLAENSMKMKEIGPRGRRGDVWDVKSTSSKSHIKTQSVEEINSAAMLAVKRSVGVTPEMNLREHVTCMPSPMLIRLPILALKPRGDVTRDISGPTKRTFVLQKR